MLVSLRRTQTWRPNTKLYKFGWHSSANNARMKNTRDLILGKVVYISIIYYLRRLTFFIEWLRFLFWSQDWWKPRILLIPNGEMILSKVNVVVWGQVKSENSSLPVSVRVSKTRMLKLSNCKFVTNVVIRATEGTFNLQCNNVARRFEENVAGITGPLSFKTTKESVMHAKTLLKNTNLLYLSSIFKFNGSRQRHVLIGSLSAYACVLLFMDSLFSPAWVQFPPPPHPP